MFRIDIVGLSSEAMPEKDLKDGTTYYTVDTKQFYIYYKGEWYEQTESEA